MIRHIVWWELKEEAEGGSLAENIERLLQSSASLQAIPYLLSVEVSAKIQPSSTVAAQFVLMSTHRSLEDLEAYRVDPTHTQFAKLVTSMSASRQCLDYLVDDHG